MVHALAAGVEALAQQRQCTAVHTHVIRPLRAGNPGSTLGRETASDGGVVDVLSTRGHRIETLGLCKLLTLGTPAARTGQPAGA